MLLGVILYIFIVMSLGLIMTFLDLEILQTNLKFIFVFQFYIFSSKLQRVLKNKTKGVINYSIFCDNCSNKELISKDRIITVKKCWIIIVK